jgi:hypothetical protein
LSQGDLFNRPPMQANCESRVVHDLALADVDSVMQIASAGGNEVSAQRGLLVLQRQLFESSHCAHLSTVFLPPGEAEADGLRGGFRGPARAFHLKQAPCVSFETSCSGAEIHCLSTLPTIQLTLRLEIPMKSYRLIALAAAVLINVLAARALVSEKVGAPVDPTQPAIVVVP